MLTIIRRKRTKTGSLTDKFFEVKSITQAEKILDREKEKLKEDYIFGIIQAEDGETMVKY